MGASFSLAVAVFALVSSIFVSLYTIAANVLSFPFRLANQFIAYGGIALSLADRVLIQRALMALGIVVVLIIIFTLGPFAVNNTSFFMETIDQFHSCFLRGFREFVNKSIEWNTKIGYEFLSDAMNKFYVFAGARALLMYDEMKTIVDCLEVHHNFQFAFDFPNAAWKLLGALPFGLLSAPRLSKVEPFPTGTYGYQYPLENFDPPAVRRYEFNPDYQAQGPATAPSSAYPNAGYWWRDTWVQLSRIWEDFGKLVLGLVSKLSRPAQRLFPAFYVDISREESVWRETADLVCRVTEFTLVTTLWPYGTDTDPLDPDQSARDDATKYLCKFYRTAACLLQRASLIVNDATTFTRPLQTTDNTCNDLPPTLDGNIQLFLRGVPVVDFFIPAGDVIPAGLTRTPNIFHSNLGFCKFMVDIHGEMCLGFATGSLSFRPGPPVVFCPEWPGTDTPLPDERIDYIALLIDCVAKFVGIFVNKDNDPELDEKITTIGKLTAGWISLIINDGLFVINAITQLPLGDGCSLGSTLGFWFGDHLTSNAIETLEFAYSDSCSMALQDPAASRNFFLCLIAFSSRKQPATFWGTLCGAIDDIGMLPGLGSLRLNCEARRKRELGDAVGAQRKLTWYESYRLYTPYYAYETRTALDSFDYCFTNPNTSMLVAPRCSTQCAVRPCIDAAIDCVRGRIDPLNYWYGALEPGSYTRSALRGTALAADAWFGCADGDVDMLFNAVNSTVEVLRDLSARTAAATMQYGVAHATCAEQADWSNSTIYLECIGLSPLGATWEETLQLNNITTDTMCGAILHDEGIKLAPPTTPAYDGCLTLFAYGSRARFAGTTTKSLAEFLNGWTAMHSMASATETLRTPRTWNTEPRNSSWMLDFLVPSAPPTLSNGTRQAVPFAVVDDTARSFHDVASLAYAYFNYQADIYERVMLRESSGAEKDATDDALYRDKVMSVATAIGIQSPTVVSARTKMQKAANAAHRHTMAQTSDPQTRSGGGGIAEVARIYGHSLLWVDRLYASTENAVSIVVAEKEGRKFVFGDDGKGSAVEFRVRQRYAGDAGGPNAVAFAPMLGVRVADQLSSTQTLADYYQQQDGAKRKTSHYSASLKANGRGGGGGGLLSIVHDTQNYTEPAKVEPLEPFAELELRHLIGALEAYSQSGGDGDVQTRQSTALALSALHDLDAQLARIDSTGAMLALRLPPVVAALGRVALRLTWNVVVSRLHLSALPAVQAAHVVIDLLTQTERTDDLERWFAGERGYIVGVGYVEMEDYLEYMDYEEIARRTLVNGYFSPLRTEEYDMMQRSSSVRRDRLLRNLALKRPVAADGTLMLEGDTFHDRFIALQRNRLRQRLDFRQRSRFLVEHGHQDDPHLHSVATKGWQHYERAVQAAVSGDVLQRRELTIIAATDSDSNQFWIGAWDSSISLAGGPPNYMTDLFASLEDMILAWINSVLLDLSLKLKTTYDNLHEASICNGPNDYQLMGTGTYRIGCLPFFYERLFKYFEFYPAPLPPGPLPYDGIFSWYTGTGDPIWPAEMIATPCALPRDPNQFPNPTVTFETAPIVYVNTTKYSNACFDATKAAVRPFCASLKCDYCPQYYHSAADFGFTTGWKVIAVWSALIRQLVAVSVTASAIDGFWFVFFLLLITEFSTLIPFGWSYAFTLLTLYIFLWGETFIRHTPERFVFQYLLLTVVRIFGPGLMWIVFLAYFANLAPIIFIGSTTPLIGDWLVAIIRWISPDQLLLWLFTGLRVVFVPLLQSVVDVAGGLDPIIVALQLHLPHTPPTVANAVYSFFCPYTLLVLVVLAVGYAIAAFVGLFVISLVLELVGGFIGPGFLVLSATSNLLTRITINSVKSDVDSNQEEMDNIHDTIEDGDADRSAQASALLLRRRPPKAIEKKE